MQSRSGTSTEIDREKQSKSHWNKTERTQYQALSLSQQSELNLDWKPLPIRTWADGSFSSVKASRTGQNRNSNGCIYFWNAVELSEALQLG